MYDLPAVKPFVYAINQPFVGHSLLGVIIKIPPTKPGNLSYQELVCTEADIKVITEILTIVKETWEPGLLIKREYLNFLGSLIDHMHPIKYLAVVFSTPKLKECMREAFDSRFKRNGFLEGFAPRLAHEKEKGTLYQYLPDFSQELNLSLDKIRLCCQLSDWEGLIRYLIEG
jgi:hypothetical protein